MSYRVLLLGCGHRKQLDITLPCTPAIYELVTHDREPRDGVDIACDLDFVGPIRMRGIEDSTFDEIHAYEVLEHCGAQGDAKFFFQQWMEFARILKPGGHFVGTVPHWQSVWAWGDPSHRRVITKEQLAFLDQAHYDQVGKTSCSDFRALYRANFKILALHETPDQLRFILRSEK